MTNTKVLDLNELYNFVLLTFSFEIILLCQNYIRIYQILKLKFKITQTNSDEEMTRTKIICLNEFNDFVVYNFFIWNHLLSQNSTRSSYIPKFSQILQLCFLISG